MEWSEQHDVLFCREILAVDLFKTKKKTTYRADLWAKIADNLNGYESPKFKVSKRAVRDRYGILAAKYNKKIREEEKASGIQVEQTELDVLLEEILERENQADEELQEGKKKAEDEKLKVDDIRRTAMETLSETKKRKVGEETETTTKSRKSVSKAIEFLREKGQRQLMLKEQEIELKKQEVEVESSKNAAAMERHESMMQMMAKQQQQMVEQMQHQQQLQQHQVNNFQTMIAQQNQMLIALFDKLIHK